ncbi:MAG: branched-chain amino acid ABC transporter permease [Caldilineae bacterium]|nr:MAG: branched-chain amino acid ABC transporter permease [Caldilineae bacterium]
MRTRRLETIFSSRNTFIGWIILLILLALYPQVTELSGIRLLQLTQIFIFITLASNWNLIGGMTGYVDFGHAVFFGVGAFVMGILVTQVQNYIVFAPGLSFWQALPIAGLAAMLFALLIGLPTLRLKGPYFSIAMLGTFVAMREIVRVLKDFTGGGRGLDLPPVLNRERDYYFMLVWMGLVLIAIWWIHRSEFGQSLMAIREDEVGAEMRGINTTKHKIIAFMLAAFSTGIIGGFWAFQNTYIDPDVVFIEQRTVEMVMASMLGGLGTVWGPPLGALILYVLQDVVWSRVPEGHLVVLGVLLIIIVLFVPEGILGTFKNPSSTSLGRLLRGYREEQPRPETVATE